MNDELLQLMRMWWGGGESLPLGSPVRRAMCERVRELMRTGSEVWTMEVLNAPDRRVYDGELYTFADGSTLYFDWDNGSVDNEGLTWFYDMLGGEL